MDAGQGRAAAPAALLVTVLLAGCLAGLQEQAPASLPSEGAPLGSVAVGGAPAAATIRFDGRELVGDCPKANDCLERSAPFWPERAYASCAGANCERTPATIQAPDDAADVTMQITAMWSVIDDDFRDVAEYMGSEKFNLRLGVGAPGAADGDVRWLASGKYGATSRLDLPAGDYEIVAVAQWGRGSYDVTITVVDDAASAATGELLPDLVVGPPRQVRIETPLGREADPLLLRAGATGCGLDEVADEEARRCLRFASDVGNDGLGPLDLLLPKEEALAARAAGGAMWVQRVHAADGSVREEPVSEADYHPTHGHYHIAAFAQTFLYEHDEATGTRGGLVAQGGKTGFCIIDGGPLDPSRENVPDWAYTGAGCCYYAVFCEMDAALEEDFSMGVSAGWFDIYPWWRSGQYVDISGVPDGVYELVTVVNPEARVIETDTENNAGGVVLRITGTNVEMLAAWTDARTTTFAHSAR